MLNEKKDSLDKPSETRIYKKELPYSITERVGKGSAAKYNALVEQASISKRLATRQRTIEAWTTVQGNREGIKKDIIREKLGLEPKSELYIKLTSVPRLAKISKPSILTRIYNFFLNIKFN